jgi:AcrR family transcriptional regulator
MTRLLQKFPPIAQRLLLAGERLYGQHGVDGVSLRQIVAAAGQANNNAIPLHFDSKSGFIQAISEMRLPPLETARLVLLDHAHAENDLGARRMLRILLMPLATDMNAHDLEQYARFTLAVIRVEPEEHPFIKSANISPASMEVHARLEQALSHLPPDVFRRRLALACNLFLGSASQVGGKLRLTRSGYRSRQLYFEDMFEAALAVLAPPFPPPHWQE